MDDSHTVAVQLPGADDSLGFFGPPLLTSPCLPVVGNLLEGDNEHWLRAYALEGMAKGGQSGDIVRWPNCDL